MCDGSGEWFRRRKRRRVKEKEVKTSEWRGLKVRYVKKGRNSLVRRCYATKKEKSGAKKMKKNITRRGRWKWWQRRGP